jgi:hypothetical protein
LAMPGGRLRMFRARLPMLVTRLPMPWDHVRVGLDHVGHQRTTLAVDFDVLAVRRRALGVEGTVVAVGDATVVSRQGGLALDARTLGGVVEYEAPPAESNRAWTRR